MAASAFLIQIDMQSWYVSCVLCRILNIPTKFGDDWSIRKGMATIFRSSRWRRPQSSIQIDMLFYYVSCVLCQILNTQTFKMAATASLNLGEYMRIWSHSCVLCQILNIPIKFGEDWSNSKEMATDFRSSRWRQRPSWKIHFQLNRQYEKGIPSL